MENSKKKKKKMSLTDYLFLAVGVVLILATIILDEETTSFRFFPFAAGLYLVAVSIYVSWYRLKNPPTKEEVLVLALNTLILSTILLTNINNGNTILFNFDYIAIILFWGILIVSYYSYKSALNKHKSSFAKKKAFAAAIIMIISCSGLFLFLRPVTISSLALFPELKDVKSIELSYMDSWSDDDSVIHTKVFEENESINEIYDTIDHHIVSSSLNKKSNIMSDMHCRLIFHNQDSSEITIYLNDRHFVIETDSTLKCYTFMERKYALYDYIYDIYH